MEMDRFDVAAKIPPNTTREQFREMLRNLLTERFGMRVHRETRNGAIYTLVVKLRWTYRRFGGRRTTPSSNTR
jgi:uncharacterized protein (TIGR03435 family)